MKVLKTIKCVVCGRAFRGLTMKQALRYLDMHISIHKKHKESEPARAEKGSKPRARRLTR